MLFHHPSPPDPLVCADRRDQTDSRRVVLIEITVSCAHPECLGLELPVLCTAGHQPGLAGSSVCSLMGLQMPNEEAWSD